MKNVINLWKGLILRSEVEKQTLMLAKSLFTWGLSSTLLGLMALTEFSTISFITVIFIFLQLLISVSSVGIYEGTSEISVNKALEKSELLANICKTITSILFYIAFFENFPLYSVFIAVGLFIWSYRAYKKKKPSRQ